MKDFKLTIDESAVVTIDGVQYYYDMRTATAYFLEDGQLAGLPRYSDGTFTLAESFLVEVENNSLKTEATADGTTLGQVWRTAEMILNGKNVVINKTHRPAVNDSHTYAVSIIIDCDLSKPDEGSSEIEWFKTPEEQQEAYDEAVRVYTPEVRA